MSNLAHLEALIFYYGEPVGFQKIASTLHIKEPEAEELVLRLQKNLSQDNERGLYCVIHEGRVQLLTKPDTGEVIRHLMKDEFKEELTPASLETLSLVAYLGPVSRPMIDFIRGVNSSYTLRNLLLRGLIDRDMGKGNMYRYRASIPFLSHIGIVDVNSLPEYESYREILRQFEEGQNPKEQKPTEEL